jgi:hypothetical protein
VYRAIRCGYVRGYVGMRCNRASQGKNRNE